MMNTAYSTVLAEALIHFLWQGALAGLLLALSLKLLSSPRWRYGAACATLFAMGLAFVATVVWLWPSAIAHSGGRPLLLDPVPLLPDSGSGAAANDTAGRLGWLAIVWMLGASLFTLRSVASWFAARRLRTKGVCAAEACWQQRARDLAARLRLSRPIMLLESGLVQVPVVVGLLRPVILLPAGLLAGFPPEQIEYFLLHELAHVGRWDYLVNLLQTVIEDLLFYHPAVWWVSSVIRTEREHCCDDVAAAHGNAKDLAVALSALEERRLRAGQLALAANGGRLQLRIRRLLGRPESGQTGAVPLLLAAGLCVSLAVALGGAPRQAPQVIPAPKSPPAPPIVAQNQAGQNRSNPGPPAESPFQRWLDEEAVYIITPEEKAAFQRLRTDDERKQFIQQFWLRRDPTPGTAQNEMQDEHYRRIAYANDKFAYPGVAGWRSGRGQVYIKFGPPDELEQHPERRTEHWLYRFMEGIGTNVMLEFDDPEGTGEYRWKSDPNGNLPPITLPANAAAGPAIKSGETLSIFVAGEPDFSRILTVNEEGNVLVPLVGPFRAQGLTLPQFSSELEKSLSIYINAPRVVTERAVGSGGRAGR